MPKTQPTVEHHLIENRVFPPPFSETAHLRTISEYEKMYRESIEDPNRFWLRHAEELTWIEPPTKGVEYSWNGKEDDVFHSWFSDGKLNVTESCVDRHLKSKGGEPALVWQGEEDKNVQVLTYKELHEDICKLANGLKKLGVEKGDRVCIYMPMVPESVVAILACARIGAIHSVVFAGFSSESLSNRINDCSCKLVITSNSAMRGGKKILLKKIVDTALATTHTVENVIVLRRTEDACEMKRERDVWYHELSRDCSPDCPPTPMNAEDPLFILYTSGSTGKPKGVVHTQAGYLLFAAMTHKYVFDIQPKDVYWCTADIGWITGHSYVIYGPLANGTTTFLYEGSPTYPDPGRMWKIIEQHKITKFYTAPTVIRTLITHGTDWPKQYDLSSLKILGTVGEPINPEAWIWYYNEIGGEKLPVVDTWWQTETGGIMISPLPFSHKLKPGSATLPFFGVAPEILDDGGKPCKGENGGNLCIAHPWPGIARTTWGDHQAFVNAYFKQFNGYYFTGDGAWRDSEGDYWLMGRIDDVLNISGHRLGTAEVESAIVESDEVAEAAVVPIHHAIKGQTLYAFVTLVDGATPSDVLKKELKELVKAEIGSIASLDYIQFTPLLPKTRSGKIVRRVLRKIAEGNTEDIGDLTTIADKDLIKELLQGRNQNTPVQ